jgi:glycosyltransferase involved in cell wall biosynthesis
MQDATLRQLYEQHQGKVSDKWSIYLTEYDRLFSYYRDKPVRMLEIGIQNGGSLEVWSKYFRFAERLVGCDINPDCAKLTYSDPRISVIVGDANAPAVTEQVFARADKFDIIIDDGSHTSSDIVRSFALYFSRIVDGGMFVAEDLHCSYWKGFQGGLFHPLSSIAFFKRLADIISHEHWGVPTRRKEILAGFMQHYDFDIDEDVLAHIHSVEFINSICVVRKEAPAANVLGSRFIAGREEIVVGGHIGMDLQPHISDESSNPWAAEDEGQAGESPRLLAMLEQLQQERDQQKRRERMMVKSLSWRATAPVRWMTKPLYRMSKEVTRKAKGGAKSAQTAAPVASVPSTEAKPATKRTIRKLESLTTKPTIAIVIPYYNGAKFIERSLASVYRQTFAAHEVIVVDDGSKPDEAAFLDKLSADGRFRLLRKSNGGQASARNVGVAAATADYICFLDQDDFFLDDHNEKLVLAVPDDDKKFGWAYGEVTEADGAGRISRHTSIKARSSTPHPKTSVYELIAADMFILPSATLISKAAYTAIGGFDEQFTGYEDDDLFLRLFRAGYSQQFVDEPVTVWCINNESTSFSVRMSNSRLLYFSKLAAEFDEGVLRNYLIPRFEPHFIDEARQALLRSTPDADEKIAILDRYKTLVGKAAIPSSHKRRLEVLTRILRTKSPRIVRAANRLFSL